MNERSSSNVLLIVEGAKTEPDFFWSLSKAYGNKALNIVSLKFNIYQLYKDLKGYDFDANTIDVLKHSPHVQEAEKEKLDGRHFPYIYLVLDMDFQEKSMTKEEKITCLREMRKHFCDETQNGLLLINYPMFESYREKISDKLEDLFLVEDKFRKYKNLISHRGINIDSHKLVKDDFRKFERNSIGIQNGIDEKEYGKEDIMNNLISGLLLEKQLSFLKSKHGVYCVNTSVLLPIFFFGENEFEEVNGK